MKKTVATTTTINQCLKTGKTYKHSPIKNFTSRAAVTTTTTTMVWQHHRQHRLL
jgi:hypothetical protein